MGGSSGGPSRVTLDKRVDRIEWQQDAIDKRLSEGAETFSEVRQSIKDIHDELKPKPIATWKIASFALTIMLLVGAWIWQAARYPDRTEFNEARQATEAKANKVQADVQHLRMEQVKIQADIKAIKSSQARTEKGMGEIKTDIKTLATTNKRRR